MSLLGGGTRKRREILKSYTYLKVLPQTFRLITQNTTTRQIPAVENHNM